MFRAQTTRLASTIYGPLHKLGRFGFISVSISTQQLSVLLYFKVLVAIIYKSETCNCQTKKHIIVRIEGDKRSLHCIDRGPRVNHQA